MKLTALLLAATVAICWANSVMIKQDKVPTALHRLMTVTGATLEENDSPTLPCNEEALYSHTSDCTKFYKCIDVSGNHDYEQLVFKCHAGTIFSAEYKSCIPGACSNVLESASASAAEVSAAVSAVVSAAASTTAAQNDELVLSRIRRQDIHSNSTSSENEMLSIWNDAASTDDNEDDYEDDHVTSSATSIFDSFMSKKSEDKKTPGIRSGGIVGSPGLWKDGTVGSPGLRQGRTHGSSELMCYTGPCPGNGIFEEIAGHCYFFSSSRSLEFTWHDSKRFCEEIGYMLGLTTVKLAEYGKDSSMSFCMMMEEIAEKGEDVWLGATDEDLEDSWFWDSGDGLSNMNSYWYPTEPNNDGNCLVADIFHPNVYGRPYFSDSDCDNKRHFVCQIF